MKNIIAANYFRIISYKSILIIYSDNNDYRYIII